jgi:hypothetical protein
VGEYANLFGTSCFSDFIYLLEKLLALGRAAFLGSSSYVLAPVVGEDEKILFLCVAVLVCESFYGCSVFIERDFSNTINVRSFFSQDIP